MKTAVLILAAGASSRMGKSKQLLPYKNTTLLGYTIQEVLALKVAKTYCVLGNNFDAIKKSISKYKIGVIFNPNYKLGLSTSIVSGLKNLTLEEVDRIFIVLADQPKVSSDYFSEMLQFSDENPKKIIASQYDKGFGVPAIFPKEYFKDLLQLKGDKGAKDLLKNNSGNIIALNSDNLLDIDTLEDYNSLLKT